MFSKLAFVAASAALLSLSSGHMVITSPFPYADATLNNSPLDASGSDYPCKQRPGVYGPAAGANNYAVGAPQVLKFKGSAVHGGGSCQLSLTTDKAPTKDSQFKVIHSIIGGCPANPSNGGNLPEDPNGSGAPTFNFTVPNDVPNGDYTFAWTWYNKVGNREIYMNCAPVTVTGSTGSPDTFKGLPNMFLAQMPGTCTVKETTNVVFPNPGKSVETGAPDSNAPPTCPAGDEDGSKPPTNGATTAAAAPAAGAPAAGAPAAGAPAAGAVRPAVAGSGSSSGSSGAAASPAAPAASSPSGVSPAAGPATPGNAAPAGSVPCPSAGQIICIGTTQFGICDTSMMAVPQPLAQGTTCSNGQIARRSLHGSSLRARHAQHGNTHQH